MVEYKKTIKKIGKNHVIVIYSLKDEKGVDVPIRQEEYGALTLSNEKKRIQKRILDLEPKEINKKKAELNIKLTDLNEIEKELNKKMIKEK